MEVMLIITWTHFKKKCESEKSQVLFSSKKALVIYIKKVKKTQVCRTVNSINSNLNRGRRRQSYNYRWEYSQTASHFREDSKNMEAGSDALRGVKTAEIKTVRQVCSKSELVVKTNT